ncbi:sulfotransferase family protein [Limnofasciculus baicalensis]|uniref:Sulfotransferase n=1 Tax=Limnofasciculus baicalensis BBK-W-15 TaxID=2699891 RepID=A0AAE3GMN1_9CYAN|nr:sulfotransferase [Limnofasciculus baicalensis]MCP2727415.1 sulfotransferase [Limnofasciculus baicalensis BBK-W-15]
MEKDTQLLSDPIFLVGAERSGTTVLRVMLKHHPQITWCNEFEYAVDLIPNIKSLASLNKYYEWLETHRIFQATGFTIDRTLNYEELVNSFLCQKRDRDGKPIVGATVHRHFDRLLQIWPNARFIHIIRDGRDVACSCISMGWAGNVWTGVNRWIEAEQLWGKISKKIPLQRRIEVTYEGLIAEPVQTLTRLCDFIGVSYDPGMINYKDTSTYDLPDPKFIQQWRRKLSEYEVQLVESRIGQMLVERGYELSGLAPITVTPIIAQRLRLQDWWYRAQFRLQHYGLSLFVSDYLSRKIGLVPWQKSVRLKLNAIETAHLK